MDRLSAVGIPRAGARGALNIAVATLALAAGVYQPPTHAVTAQAAAQHGTLAVVVRTTATARPPLRVSVDANICGDAVPDESVVLTRGLVANAVVTLPGLPGTHPASVDIVNDRCRFVPHVAIAAPGAALRMVSRDATLHTVHAEHRGKSLFNVGLPVPNLTLTRPAQGNGPVALKCNTHPWMSGFVFLAADRAVLTGQDGSAAFAQLPAGTHKVTVWHEVLGTASAVASVEAGRHTSVEITLPGK